MVNRKNKKLIELIVKKYLDVLRENNIPVWRIYLYGSYVRGTNRDDSDIDLAVFWDKDDIDGFDEDVQLFKLTKKVDLRIEPHSFARTDFDETDPYIKEIVQTGERVV